MARIPLRIWVSTSSTRPVDGVCGVLSGRVTLAPDTEQEGLHVEDDGVFGCVVAGVVCRPG